MLEWFDGNARALPWRTPVREPYPTLVAETMLQQTQAARAALAYGPFLRTFPDLRRLAEAEEREVLLMWQGLGYYRRARALHAAARVVVAEHGGRLPRDVLQLERLPGIGRYTAVAIAAQAFGVPGIAVDANVRRVGARILAQDSDEGSPRTRDAAIVGALEVLVLRAPGSGARRRSAVPEALIELGALVCTPRRPACDRCPLAPACGARTAGEPERYGRPPARSPGRRETSRALVVLDRGAVALVRRPATGRWAGLWGFPILADGAIDAGRSLKPVQHVLTHRRLHVIPVVADARLEPAEATWVPLAELASGGGPVPVAVLDRKLARRVAESLADAEKEGEPA